MKPKMKTKDPDLLGSYAALKRASKRAWKDAVETQTPFYVWKDGKVVNLNPNVKRTRKKRFPPLL